MHQTSKVRLRRAYLTTIGVAIALFAGLKEITDDNG